MEGERNRFFESASLRNASTAQMHPFLGPCWMGEKPHKWRKPFAVEEKWGPLHKISLLIARQKPQTLDSRDCFLLLKH